MTPGYVDAEWLSRRGPEVRAVDVERDGRVSFGDRSVATPPALEPDAAALLAFGSLAAEVAALVGAREPHAVDVVGRGIIAALIRVQLGELARGGEPPQVVVDTTGDLVLVAEATRRLVDMGTLVLAGETSGRTGDLDTYPDIHVRGLEVVGAGPLLSHALPDDAPGDLPPPAALGADATPVDALWYRIAR